jgi:hypothetical protein
MLINVPFTKIETAINAKAKRQLLNKTSTEAQTVIHGSYKGDFSNDKCRICKPVYLVDSDSLIKSKLVYADGIEFYPKWNNVADGETKYFTLVFEGLPKECKAFDFIESEIEWEQPFIEEDIPRNSTDVYYVRFK